MPDPFSCFFIYLQKLLFDTHLNDTNPMGHCCLASFHKRQTLMVVGLVKQELLSVGHDGYIEKTNPRRYPLEIRYNMNKKTLTEKIVISLFEINLFLRIILFLFVAAHSSIINHIGARSRKLF